MKATLLFCVFVLSIAATAIVLFSPPLSAPVPVAEQPKLAYHVVYFWVCDQLIGTLLTTEPAIWVSVEDGLPDREIIDMMIAIEGTSRSLNVKHRHPGCFSLVPPDLLERT